MGGKVQVEMEAAESNVGVVESCTRPQIPEQRGSIKLQVDTEAAEMVQFNQTIATTMVKLPSWQNMELVWWSDVIRLHDAQWSIRTAGNTVLHFNGGWMTQLLLSKVMVERIDCTD